MSFDMTDPPVGRPISEDDFHFLEPEDSDGRQRLGVWLFIGGDIIIVSALLFTYLYLRRVDTSGHWMSLLGFRGHSDAYYQHATSLPAPRLIHVKPMSAGFEWLITAVTVLSAGIIWQGERALRVTKNAKAFSRATALASIITLVAIVLTVIQLRSIPEIFVATNDSQGMAYTAYDSAFMALVGSGLVHLVILACLGLGLTIRTSRGLITGARWYQARPIRMFWVWIAVASVIVAGVTTTINTIQ